MPAYPLWAVMVFMVDVIIVFGLLSYGGRDRRSLAWDVVAERDVTLSHAGFRYGAAFALTLLVVVIAILAPSGDVTRAVILALESAALVVVVATSRARAEVRREWGLLAAGAGTLLTLGVLVGVVPKTVVLACAGALALAIPVALAGGLLRLVRCTAPRCRPSPAR